MLLEASNLTKRYGRREAAVPALQGVSFEIKEGAFVAIRGPSGSGKSTLLSIIGLLGRPTSGTLAFRGECTTKLDHDRLAALRNRSIGFVFQSFNLLARNTSLENVQMPLIYSSVPRSTRKLRAEAALEAVGLAHRLKHWPGQLSGGEQQRVAIARALVNDPALILADEPTGSLDTQQGLSILALFQKLNEAGRTVILVTHDDQVARRARRILELKDGRLVSDGPAARVRPRACRLETAGKTMAIPKLIVKGCEVLPYSARGVTQSNLEGFLVARRQRS
jgi:putative ABC transport system ATP-binding protein